MDQIINIKTWEKTIVHISHQRHHNPPGTRSRKGDGEEDQTPGAKLTSVMGGGTHGQ